MKKNKKTMKTYDEIVLDHLREIEPATLKQLSRKLGLNHSTYSLIKRLVEKGLLNKNMVNKPYTYTIKERVVSYD